MLPIKALNLSLALWLALTALTTAEIAPSWLTFITSLTAAFNLFMGLLIPDSRVTKGNQTTFKKG